jgi:hypothetical protein
MSNVLRGLKNASGSQPTPSSEHDLEQALEAAGDARDIARDMLRRLPDYDGSEEESTARHEMPQMHVHVHQHSEPDLRETETTVDIGPVKVKGLPKWLVAVAVPVAAGVTALVAWLLRR